jgi:hypothetical protein
MRVRRGGARLATIFGVLAPLVFVGAAPAAADDDKVNIQAPGTFVAGGSAGSVTVSVAKRTKGCVVVSTALAIRLDGLSADQVQVELAAGGQWQPVPVSGGGQGVVTQRTSPERPVLCDKKSLAVRYRLTFLAGAPTNEATVVGEAFGSGVSIDQDSDTAEVVARKGGNPTPARSVTASPTPGETVAAVPPTQSQPPAAAATPPAGQGGKAGFFGVGSVVMLLGVGMVGIGIALLVLLLRRGRGARDEDVTTGQPAAGYPGMAPAAGGYPGMAPAAGGYPVGQQFPPPPAAAGGEATVIMPKLPY